LPAQQQRHTYTRQSHNNRRPQCNINAKKHKKIVVAENVGVELVAQGASLLASSNSSSNAQSASQTATSSINEQAVQSASVAGDEDNEENDFNFTRPSKHSASYKQCLVDANIAKQADAMQITQVSQSEESEQTAQAAQIAQASPSAQAS